MAYILRAAGRALHTSEIRARHKEMFGKDITEGQTTKVLQSMEEALIVRRGFYDLYENLSLTDSNLADIRNTSYSFLSSKRQYISAKVIYKKLFKDSHERFGTDFSSYMLLGILQDDTRFSVKPGLMVAIAGVDTDIQFQSLTEEIIDIIIKYGPIQIKDIAKYLEEKRSVHYVNSLTIINGSDRIVATGIPRYYHTVEAVIGGPEEVAKLNDCIEVYLLDGAKSLHFIKTELSQNGIDLKKRTIKSWLYKLGGINFEKGVYRLVDPSQNISSYQVRFDYLQQKGLAGEQLRDALSLEFDCKPENRFIDFDHRLRGEVFEGQSSMNVFDSILEEFNF